ncbi:hypothetical protein AX17_004463 [Amanita inopinata Kibby_2008]|nr:hypothetical protein AX17_004463 [Amanita inopinata Kibby_2008]
MLKRYHAQRQHIISSFDALLYQLHTLSFFLAPSLSSLFCRLIAQSQCTKPRDYEMARSLRFYLVVIVMLNSPSLWNHTMQTSSSDRAVVLDFVGLAYIPSKLQLITLDLTIIFLQLLLTTIAYETSLSMNVSEPDFLMPSPPLDLPTHTLPSSSDSQPITPRPIRAKETALSPQYVMDLRLRPILSRLRNPPPIRPSLSNASLPLPNTTPWTLPTGMGMMLLRAGGRVRPGGSNRTGRRDRRIPGTLDTQDA